MTKPTQRMENLWANCPAVEFIDGEADLTPIAEYFFNAGKNDSDVKLNQALREIRSTMDGLTFINAVECLMKVEKILGSMVCKEPVNTYEL